MTSGISESPIVGLGKLLIDHRLQVPRHQRDYSWNEDRIKQLFDDIDEAIERKDQFYFIGLMVFLQTESGTPLTVLDGQQRLATAVIFFSAVRNWLRQYQEYQQDAAYIQEWFVGRAKLGTREPTSRLVLNAANNPFFTEHVITAVPIEETKAALSKLKRFDRNRRLLEATVYCHDRVARIVSESPDAATASRRLFQIVSFMEESVSAVRLVVQSEGAAYTIFETLNDRGQDLSPLDLVKNYMFGKADQLSPTTLRDLDARWAQMMATLPSVRPDAFLKAFWTSRNGRIQTPNLFDALKKEYREPPKLIDLSIDMLGASEQYVAIDTPEDVAWSSYSPATRQTIQNFKTIGSQQIHPIILAGLARFKGRELERLIRLLEVLLVRFQLIGGGRTGRLEISCARLAHLIFQQKVTDASAAFRELSDIYPEDDEFRDAFSKKDETSNQKIQYILKRLEEEERRLAHGSMSKELEPGSSLTVEHILPQHPGSAWDSVIRADPEVVEDCADRLGNLCLLTKVNRELGRAGFDTKKETYAKSALLITQKVTNYGTWGRAFIEKRQAHLAKLAVSAWRFQ
jgi:hypothetical protein